LFNKTSWAANKIIGEPRVYPNYGDRGNTWAQRHFTDNEFITVKFPEKVFINNLNIYETYHGGAITNIQIKDLKTNEWITIWQSESGAYIETQSRIFSPQLNCNASLFKTNQVKLILDCSVASSWCEIDAIEMVGQKYSIPLIDTEKELSNDLKNLLKSEELSDIQFEVNGKVFKVHRNIITARSEHFRAMLCENLRTDRLARPIHIDKVSLEAFECLLNYFYTDSLIEGTSCQVACELIRVSDWYNIESLDQVCFKYIANSISLDNVIAILVCALTIEPKLKDVELLCCKFIAKNFTVIIDRSDFKSLPQFILIRITQYYAKFCG
jgi:speckle-type POZ protein